ncbi:hypothetical protein [Paraburkholderia phenoliruptrix]|uniref:hypothetical protein n=1 Tax=Paraburkholderia phenoliruptrix TaxID=252970 RepID=UPI002860BC16|nr:hypothetical protein [Paraburkholderia phenoliruptrix]MDR6393030.1 hypothetical protein [Paraburkholderia phenoliruptrix]
MDIQDIRRHNLRAWVDRHGRPATEKSYFSQLLKDQSFGERVARRLERQYGMGEGFLDSPVPEPVSNPPKRSQKESLSADANVLIKAIHRLDSLSDPARKLFPVIVQMLNVAENLTVNDNSAAGMHEFRSHERTIGEALSEGPKNATRRHKHK